MTKDTRQIPIWKVLIVSPHFATTNAPDMQHMRLALPCFKALGLEPVVLALDFGMIEGGVIEPLLEDTYPRDMPPPGAECFDPPIARQRQGT